MHAILGFIMVWIYIGIETWVKGGELRMSTYTARMWGMAYGSALPDSVGLLLMTLAYQKDRSGFTALISYMAIVYSYIADQVIFSEHFKAIELIAAIVILFTALGVAFYKLRQQQIASSKALALEKKVY